MKPTKFAKIYRATKKDIVELCKSIKYKSFVTVASHITVMIETAKIAITITVLSTKLCPDIITIYV